MLKSLMAWFRGMPTAQPLPAADPAQSFADLNRQAPLRDRTAHEPAPEGIRDTYLCREAVLGRDQRIAGYQFLLKEGVRNRIRVGSRTVHHVYAEVLVRNLVEAGIARLLGHRMAFIDIPDSFAEHACLEGLDHGNVVLVLQSLPGDGAPPTDRLCETVRALRQRGIRVAIPDPGIISEFAPLLPEVDFVMLKASVLDARRCLVLMQRLHDEAPATRVLVRELGSTEDFGFVFKLDAHLFQGPFVTSREDWKQRQLGPDAVRVAQLLARLRQDAASAEIADLTKHDPALSLRLLRYVNSAANALPQPVSSIDHAIQIMGREKLYRWLMILLCSTHAGEGRPSAAMESALVRARLMELLGDGCSRPERETLFLTGLLSLIDVILEVPLERALAPLGVPNEIQRAILGHEGAYGTLLELACACENGDGADLDAAAQRCGISAEQASQRHIEALAWALEIQP